MFRVTIERLSSGEQRTGNVLAIAEITRKDTTVYAKVFKNRKMLGSLCKYDVEEIRSDSLQSTGDALMDLIEKTFK